MSRRRHRSPRDWAGDAGGGGDSLWQWLSRLFAGLALVGMLAAGVVILLPELDQQRFLDQEISGLEEVLRGAEAERDRARAHYSWMRHNPEYLEFVARDVLDLCRPGETIFQIERDRAAE